MWDFSGGRNWVEFCQELLSLKSAFGSEATSDERHRPRFWKNARASAFGCQQPVFAEALSCFFDLSRSSGCINAHANQAAAI